MIGEMVSPSSFKNQMQKPQLTTQEENVIKDILKLIGNDSELNRTIAKACQLSEVEFDAITDSAFKKLGNGRVTLVQS